MNPYLKEAQSLFGRGKKAAPSESGKAEAGSTAAGPAAEGLATRSESAPNVAVDRRPCPECGAGLEWSARKQALACPYCGTVVPWHAAKAGAGDGSVAPDQERDLEEALRNPANLRNWGAGRRELKCQSCHAISVFVDGKVASRCDFCGSAAIVPHEQFQDAITPQSLLPFKISEAQVRDRLRAWYGSRWFAPNRLRHAALTDTLKGIYLPYWTFDAHTHAFWRAEAGHHYFETQMVRGADGRMQPQQVQKVRWVPASGQLEHFFDDELVPGTVGVHPALLRRIEPFPTTTDLKAYSPEYVRGWTVERYQVDLRKAATIGQQQMAEKLRAACAARVPGDTYRNLRVDVRYDGRTFKHVLVPVWLVAYTYGSRTFQVVVNGYDGKIAGEQPYSWVKIALAVVLALIVLAALAYSQQ